MRISNQHPFTKSSETTLGFATHPAALLSGERKISNFQKRHANPFVVKVGPVAQIPPTNLFSIMTIE